MICRTCLRSSPRSRAIRGTWNSAAAGVMSGSRPEAEVVTRSMGTGCPGFSACNVRHVAIHPIDQLLIGGSKIGSAGIRGIIAIARRRRPRVQISRPAERLADDPRSNDLAVARDELTVGLVVEHHLRQTSHDQRIDNSQQHRRNHVIRIAIFRFCFIIPLCYETFRFSPQRHRDTSRFASLAIRLRSLYLWRIASGENGLLRQPNPR